MSVRPTIAGGSYRVATTLFAAGALAWIAAWSISSGFADSAIFLAGTGACLAGAALGILQSWSVPDRRRPLAVIGGLAVAFILVRAVSNVANDLPALTEMRSELPLAGLVLVLAMPTPLIRRVGPWLGVLATAAFVGLVVALVQITTRTDPTEAVLSNLFGDGAPAREPLWKWRTSNGAIRARGTFAWPLTFAGVMAMLSGVALARAVHGRWPADARRRRRVAHFGFAVIAAAGVVISYSRGYVVVLGAAVAFIGLTLSGRRLAPLLGIGGLAAVAILALPGTRARFAGLLDATLHPSAMAASAANVPEVDSELAFDPARDTAISIAGTDRPARLMFGLELVAERPLLGLGADGARYWEALDARSKSWRKRSGVRLFPAHVHNNYLQIAIESGVIGLAVWLALLAAIVRLLVGAIANGLRDSLDISLPLGALAATIVFSAGGLFDDTRFAAEVYWLWAWLVGIGLVANSRRDLRTPAMGDPILAA